MRARAAAAMIVALLTGAAAGLMIGDARADAPAKPMRIVSLNPCIDVLLVELVPRERIAAISHYSRDDWRSTIAPLARTLPITYESAEEVVALAPDLVLAGRHSAIATRNALSRVGIRFELFAVPSSVAASLEQIRLLARLLGEEPRGAALIRRIEHALASARPPAGARRPTAAVYQPGGMTAGAETVTADLMEAAGLENLAARHGVVQHRPLSIEKLLRDPPDILLVSDTATGSTRAERVVRHRALRALEERMLREPFPAKLLYCAGPTMIDALAALTAARDSALRSAPRVAL